MGICDLIYHTNGIGSLKKRSTPEELSNLALKDRGGEIGLTTENNREKGRAEATWFLSCDGGAMLIAISLWMKSPKANYPELFSSSCGPCIRIEPALWLSRSLLQLSYALGKA